MNLTITEFGLYPNSTDYGQDPCPPSEENVQICLKWLSEFTTRAGRWTNRHSYGFKHDVEHWAGEYVTNGAFIEAAERMGYPWKQEARGSPNAIFKMRFFDKPVGRDRPVVYLIQCGPYYKIGVSGNVQKRIKQLGALPPFDIELLHTISGVDVYSLEKDLHRLYASKRKRGEWFELDQDDVEYIEGL